MTFFEKKIPVFLTERKNTIRQLLFTSLFALIFINIYSPFGIETWNNLKQIQLLLYSSGVIMAGLLVIAFSRIIMHQVFKKKELSYLSYILWITAEILSLAVVYVLLQYFFVSKPDDVMVAFESNLKKTSLVLLFPYSLSFLYFSWREKTAKLDELSGNVKIEKPQVPAMVPFRDEKQELRFSVKTKDLLYLEAADNYVSIYYMDSGKLKKYLIRNSMKNMEEGLKKYGIIRCHRSYMVNFECVKIMRKEQDGLVLELETVQKRLIPISKTYVDEVMSLFSVYSG